MNASVSVGALLILAVLAAYALIPWRFRLPVPTVLMMLTSSPTFHSRVGQKEEECWDS